MGLQDVIRWFLPREDHFYGFLENQAHVASEGAQALLKFATNGVTAEEARDEVQKYEHRGDGYVREMEDALAKTFVTPIDREDLQKLSSDLDTVLDLMNGAIRACVLLGVEKPTEPMAKLIEIIVECTGKIAASIPKLKTHEYADILTLARELRQIEKRADIIYREAVSSLFRPDASGSSLSRATGGAYREGLSDARVLIREKAVLDDLENAIDQCDALADTLTQLAVKNG